MSSSTCPLIFQAESIPSGIPGMSEKLRFC